MYATVYQIGITPSGCAVFVSKGMSPSLTDQQAAVLCGAVDFCHRGGCLMVDRGYKGLRALAARTGRSVEMPGKQIRLKPGQTEKDRVHFPLPTAQHTYTTSSLRVHDERQMRRTKEFTLLKRQMPMEYKDIINDMVLNATFLGNFGIPLAPAADEGLVLVEDGEPRDEPSEPKPPRKGRAKAPRKKRATGTRKGAGKRPRHERKEGEGDAEEKEEDQEKIVQCEWHWQDCPYKGTAVDVAAHEERCPFQLGDDSDDDGMDERVLRRALREEGGGCGSSSWAKALCDRAGGGCGSSCWANALCAAAGTPGVRPITACFDLAETRKPKKRRRRKMDWD